MEDELKKRMLIIKACDLATEVHECSGIKTQAEMYDIHVEVICPTCYDELKETLGRMGAFDYIYLSAHGSVSDNGKAEGFTNKSGSLDVLWSDFGTMLCEQGCLRENVVLMLSCCRGGLNEVAYELFYACRQIDYIVGPRQSLAPYEMLICFNILLYNVTHRDVDPIVACEKIKAGTDIRMVCFDRLEMASEPGYQWFVASIEQESAEEENAFQEDARANPVALASVQG